MGSLSLSSVLSEAPWSLGGKCSFQKGPGGSEQEGPAADRGGPHLSGHLAPSRRFWVLRAPLSAWVCFSSQMLLNPAPLAPLSPDRANPVSCASSPDPISPDASDPRAALWAHGGAACIRGLLMAPAALRALCPHHAGPGRPGCCLPPDHSRVGRTPVPPLPPPRPQHLRTHPGLAPRRRAMD